MADFITLLGTLAALAFALIMVALEVVVLCLPNQADASALINCRAAAPLYLAIWGIIAFELLCRLARLVIAL